MKKSIQRGITQERFQLVKSKELWGDQTHKVHENLDKQPTKVLV